MNCLEDYIGLNHCSVLTTPESGLYLNDLPGVEIANIDAIANSEQSTFVGVWEEIQKRALARFKTDVIAEFGKRYRLRQVQQTVNMEKIIDTNTITAAAAQWRGYIIELNRENDDYVYSNMQVLAVQYLYLYLGGIGNIPIRIFDLETGEALYSSTLSGVAGWNTILVNRLFIGRRFFLCYDATAVNSVELDITKFHLDNVAYFNQDWYHTYWNCTGSISRMRGAYSPNTSTVTAITESNNTYGFSGIWSVKCAYDSVVCYNKELFAQALLYCLGSELMTERINSSRINRWTTVDKPKAIELRKYFEAKYKGGVYDDITFEGELCLAIYGIDLNKYDACLQCDNIIVFREAKL